MKKKILGILDVDEEYAMNLVSFMNKRNHRECEIAGFTSIEDVTEYLKTDSIELLLVSDKVDTEKIKELNIEKVIVLSEEEPTDKEKPTVYKYQSAQLLVREVMTYYAKMEAMKMSRSKRLDEVRKIGVFTFSQGCVRMMAAMSMAQEIGKKEPVLYLNFEEHTGIRKLLHIEQGGDLSDFVYYYKHKREHLEEKLNQFILKKGNMDMMAPLTIGRDLYETPIQEWQEVIEEIAAISHYHTIVLDVGAGENLETWMNMCDEIYLVYMDCLQEKTRLEEFQEYLRNTGEKEILDRLILMKVSNNVVSSKEEYLQELCDSEFYREIICQMNGRLVGKEKIND